MNVFLDDLVNGLFHQVQDKMELLLEDDDDDVVVEKEHKWNTTTTTTTSTKPPKSTDLLYLTDRLLLSSAPRLANPPQYHDRGRDERRRRRRRRPTTTTTATTTTSQPITPPQGKDDDDHDDDHDDDDNAKEPPPPAAAAAAVAATDDDSNVATTEPHPETPTNPSSMETPAAAAAAEAEDPNYQATVEKTTTTTTNHHHTNHPPPPIIKRRRRMMMMIPDNQISPSQHPRQNNNETPSAMPPTTTTTPQGGDHHPKDSSSSSNTTTMIDATTTSLDDDPASSIIMMGDDDDNHNHNHNHVSIPGVVATDPSPTTTTTTLSTLSQDNNDDRQPPPQQPVMMDDHDDDEHDDHDDDEHDDSSPAAALCDPPPPSVPQHHHPEEDAPPTTAPTTTIHNSPATMVTYLEQRHGKNHFLAFSFMDTPPDDRTLLLFRRQLVHLGWWSPCPERSETPSIPKLLEACYAMHAYLQLDPSNVAWVYCANGKSRTAIVLACYLKFAGFVSHSCQGFCHFLIKTFQLGDDNAHKSRSRRSRRRRRPNHPPPSKDEKKAATTTTTTTMIWNQLPPSLRLFFRQFDTVVDMGGYPNNQHPKQPSSSLLLRAIALQGIPVEDKPCLDLWDSSQRHVYSSHPEMWKKKNHHPHHNNNNNNKPTTKPSSQWADEEGFYKVNVVLEGDFLLLCRFGGDFAQEATTIHDPTKILFRYANTTGFLSGGCPYELPPQKVDLSRRYASHLDDEDFLVTLLFEADWERMDDDDDDDDVEQRAQASSSRVSSSHKQVWRSHEQQACEEGWNIIFQHHSARPDKSDIRDFQRFCHNKNLGSCSDHLVCLALQLTNFEYKQAERLLLDSPSFAWWQQGVVGDENNGADTNKISSTEETKDFDQRNGNQEKEFDCHQDRATREISDILDEIDVSSNLELPDVVQMENFETSASSYRARLENMATPKRRGGSGQFPRKQQHPHAFADPCLRDYGWMVPSMMYPRRGDILGLFGPNYQQFHSMLPSRNNVETPPSITSRTRPRMPFVARDRPKMFLPGAKRQRQDSTDDCMPFPVPPYDPRREAALQLFLGVRHTGVTLPGLIDLVESSQQWSGVPMVDEEDSTSIKESGAIEMEKPTIQASGSRDASMNRDAKEQQQKKWDEARKAEEKDKEDKKKAEDAKKKDEEEKAATESKGEDPNTKANSGEVPLKDDPDFAKYFKMLKMGMAKEQVLHAMKRDDKDPIILDLDPNKSMKAQLPKESKTTDGGVPLKDDPEYVKYFKMLKMGLPVGAVKNALQKDGKDPSIMDLDPNKSLKSQKKESENDDDGPALQDDPEYQKYFKMLNMGLPLGAVKNAITKDGKDPSIMDLDPKKSAKSQMGGNATATDNGPPLKEDPEYVKYFKMLSMGLPMGAVKNALSRDGKDPAIMDLDPNTSIKSQLGGQAEEKDTGIPLKDDPEYTKYFKMLIMGLPKGAVKNALERDGKNPAIMDLDPNKSVAFQLKKPVSANKKPAKKKRVRRKKIYWNPIDPLKLKADSMWNIVRGSVIMGKLNYDVKEFEDLFTEDPAADKKKKKGNTNKAAKKLVQVIDGKRDMNGGIILARLKTDYSKIARIVTKMYVLSGYC